MKKLSTTVTVHMTVYIMSLFCEVEPTKPALCYLHGDSRGEHGDHSVQGMVTSVSPTEQGRCVGREACVCVCVGGVAVCAGRVYMCVWAEGVCVGREGACMGRVCVCRQGVCAGRGMCAGRGRVRTGRVCGEGLCVWTEGAQASGGCMSPRGCVESAGKVWRARVCVCRWEGVCRQGRVCESKGCVRAGRGRCESKGVGVCRLWRVCGQRRGVESKGVYAWAGEVCRQAVEVQVL